MPSGPCCRCLLCRIETELSADLRSSGARYAALRGSAPNGLRSFASPLDLVSHLKATQAGPSSDDLLRELLAARPAEPQLVETLLIVAFVPVLHGPVRRIVKRQLFAWAAREGAVLEPASRTDPAARSEAGDDNEIMERHAALRHFLHRCLANGLLNDAELDLLIQLKLDGNTGEEIAESNSLTANAVRQRMKRLLAKLRRLAGSAPAAG